MTYRCLSGLPGRATSRFCQTVLNKIPEGLGDDNSHIYISGTAPEMGSRPLRDHERQRLSGGVQVRSGPERWRPGPDGRGLENLA